MGILQAWVRFLSKCIVSECPDDRIERNREDAFGGFTRMWRYLLLCTLGKSSKGKTKFQASPLIRFCVMTQLFADLPGEVQDAYENSNMRALAAGSIGLLAGSSVIEAILVVDNLIGIVYTTRDGGKTFEVARIDETVHLSEFKTGSRYTVHPIISLSTQSE